MNNESNGLEQRHEKLFDQEWSHHTEHSAKIGEHEGHLQGLIRAIEDLHRRIAVLESLHMLHPHDTAPRAPRLAKTPERNTPGSTAAT